jgi:TolB protein
MEKDQRMTAVRPRHARPARTDRPDRRRPRRRPLAIPLAALAAAGALAAGASPLLAPAPPAAQEPPQQQPGSQGDVTVVLEGRQRPLIRLALPEMEGWNRVGGVGEEAGRELDETLRSDLELSRAFEIQGPWAFQAIELTGDRARDFEQYRSLGNEVIVLGSLRAEPGGRIAFEGRVYDLGSGKAILGKRYRGEPSAARRIAHTFADEVLQYVAGLRGIAMTSIAFASTRSGAKEIWAMDYDGANPRPVTGHKSTSLSPDWAPGNARLAYTSFVGGPPGVYVADLGSGRKTPVATDGDQNISPSFSPDGRRVVFSRALGPNPEIYVADVGGGNLRQLTHSQAIDTNPAWSPTGREIAFTSSRGGNPHIYLMDADGSNLRRISFEGDYNDGAAWSPEGDALVYASRRGGRFEIARTELATGETRALTSGEGSNESPSFAPDGRKIAYTSTRSGSPQVWVMDADGSNPHQLTREGRNETPAWSGFAR